MSLENDKFNSTPLPISEFFDTHLNAVRATNLCHASETDAEGDTRILAREVLHENGGGHLVVSVLVADNDRMGRPGWRSLDMTVGVSRQCGRSGRIAAELVKVQATAVVP
ncbi:hypothetical protein KO481_23355 [Nocardia sp. NEAU-G5]|uniref:Uncharacterized protein n=1 Tax=Nocardia albiluteola TaxID=2842303 RepID=A0ABS6B2C6_9NOCA|nr:hypothetical protein [Nocardia albiluteola]MBU3064457.1 hypothetical protein [Nocardia albiluteola]